MSGLVELDEYDQSKQTPGLSDHWEHNQDYSAWVFHIRENAKWSNGDPVTAHDFVASYRRILTAELGLTLCRFPFYYEGSKRLLCREAKRLR